MLTNYTNKEVPQLYNVSVVIFLFIHSFSECWASKIYQALTFQGIIQKGLAALQPHSFWFVHVHSYDHTLALSPPGIRSPWTHKCQPHLPIDVCLLFLYMYQNYHLILLTPLVSHHLEVSKHNCIQILTYLETTVSHSNSIPTSTPCSGLLCLLNASTMTSPARVNQLATEGSVERNGPRQSPGLCSQSVVCIFFCQLPA